MSRLRLGLARAATILATILLWTWLLIKLFVTLIGATTVVDDYNQLIERLPSILAWLFSTPWPVPAALATALTLFLIWLSWPRSENKSGETGQTDAVSSPDWDQPLEKHLRVRFRNETVLLDGHEFIDCNFENVTFKFDGTKPFRFTGKNTGNSRKVTTDNKIVGQTLTLALFLRPDLGLDYEVHKTGARLSQQTTSKRNVASDIASSSN